MTEVSRVPCGPGFFAEKSGAYGTRLTKLPRLMIEGKMMKTRISDSDEQDWIAALSRAVVPSRENKQLRRNQSRWSRLLKEATPNPSFT